MAIFERGETYVHRVDIRNRSGIKTDPSTVSITIYDPCNIALITHQSMVSDATGEYYYNYSISNTAMYGKYITEVDATSNTGNLATTRNVFYIMPWDALSDVRDVMGLSDTKSIDDDSLTKIIWDCYQYTMRDIYIHYMDDIPDPDPNNGYWFDGSNTHFQTKHYPLADINGDGNILGSGDTTSCASDITCYWIDTNGHYNEGKIKITAPIRGEIDIFQSDGTSPIPQTQEGVYLNYWIRSWRYDEYLFRQAVVRLVCHELSKRLVSMDKVTLADIRGNNPIVVIDPEMYMKEYHRYVRKNAELALGGV